MVGASGLYYPWMHIQSEDWLKVALLQWDTLFKIRPIDAEDRDSDLVRFVRENDDGIVDVGSDETALESVTAVIFELLESVDSQDLKRFRVPTDASKPQSSTSDATFPPGDWARVRDAEQAIAPESNVPRLRRGDRTELARRDLTWVYVGRSSGWRPGSRMGPGLADTLVVENLAIEYLEPDVDGFGPPRRWLGMRPLLGTAYLVALAEQVAENNSLCPVTDDPSCHSAFGALDGLRTLVGAGPVGESTIETANAETAYLELAIRAVLRPYDLGSVPMETILEIRRRYRPELLAFHRHVQDLGEELRTAAQATNAEVAARHVDAIYRSTTEPQLRELRRAMRGLGVETGLGLLTMKADASVLGGSAAGLALGVATTPLAGVAAVAITVIPYLASRWRHRDSHLADSPVAYLYNIERDVSAAI